MAENGVIRVEIDEIEGLQAVDELKQPVEMGNLKWESFLTFGAFSETSERTGHVRNLGLLLHCNKTNRSNLWRVSARIQFKIVKTGTDIGATSDEFEVEFSARKRKLEVPNFMNWQEVTCPENGYVEANTAVVEAHVHVRSIEGIQMRPLLETFEQPNGHLTDGVLLVEGKRVHVSKQILAQHSKLFLDLLYSSSSEISIDDVVHSEFVDLLNVIYPSHKEIDTGNVAHLLRLSDRFAIPMVLEKCENFLISCRNIHLVEKLKYAEMYRLSRLQNQCLEELKTNEEVLRLAQHSGYPSLGDVTQTVLFQRVIELSQSTC
ncbi:unnamed protein product [Caenorhabditis sp. 36 PRJEB53466]|nr:unnamed protein product [Caenorhabditis sp. 36 PRJEB53466]